MPHMYRSIRLNVWIRSCRTAIFICLAALSIAVSGCAQYLANIVNVINGPPVPAEFKSLDGKRVTVVASTESGMCSDETSIRLAGNVRGILAKNLPKSVFINQEEIDQWLNQRSSSDKDLASIGRGTSSDYVLAIQLSGLKLKEGATLYKGRSDILVSVCEVKSGKSVYQKNIPEYTYPVLTGQSATETNEDGFRRTYLLHAADKIARLFYAHEIGQDFAIDATIINH